MPKYRYNVVRSPFDSNDFSMKALVSPVEGVKLPPAVSLRKDLLHFTSLPFDQGKEGSCTANTGAAHRMHIVLHNSHAEALPAQDFELSRAFLYAQERMLEGKLGKDSGASPRDLCKALQKVGICEERFMPYQAGDYTETPSSDADKNALGYTVKSYHRLFTIDEVKQQIALRKLGVMTSIMVYPSLESDEVAKTGILPDPDVSQTPQGGHEVYLVGYDDDKKMFEVLNSWGKTWGDGGFFFMPYSYVELGVAFEFWVAV